MGRKKRGKKEKKKKKERKKRKKEKGEIGRGTKKETFVSLHRCKDKS